MGSLANPTILIVDELHHVNDALCGLLGRHGYDTVCVADLGDLERRLRDSLPDLFILDVEMRGADGFELCRKLSELGPPVIVTSGLADDTDRILGLEMGARDYLAKPFNPRELVARVRAVLRHHERKPVVPEGRVDLGGFYLDLFQRKLVGPDQQSLSLTDVEFGWLRLLAARPGQAVARETLWSEHSNTPLPIAYSRAINVQVSRLRKKLRTHAGRDLIVTLRGKGYMLDTLAGGATLPRRRAKPAAEDRYN